MRAHDPRGGPKALFKTGAGLNVDPGGHRFHVRYEETHEGRLLVAGSFPITVRGVVRGLNTLCRMAFSLRSLIKH